MERGWNPNEEISLNCPRCGSCNTKFCYYNNYSLTQPRYFCKGCRRYWTKGGSLRNVPVGGGCRRSRRSAKSIRLSSAPPAAPARVFSHANSNNNNNNNFIHSSTVFSSSGCRVFKNDHCALCVSKSAGTNIASGTIDIAQVYANFLNHQPKAVEMTGLPPSGGSGIQYPSFHFASMHVEFSSHPQFTSDNIMNDGLPPLPGEEEVLSNMEWPGSEIMAAPNHIFNAPQMSAGIEQGIPQNSDPFIGNNNNSFHTSGYGYETLSRPW